MIIYFKTFLRLSIYLSWVKNPDRFDVHRDGFQTLTIQQSGIYQFEVIGAGTHRKRPGVRIIGNSQLEKGQKITVALGQKGNTKCGAGGTFVVLADDENPKPLFIAAGAGYAYDKNFAKGQFLKNPARHGLQLLIDRSHDTKYVYVSHAKIYIYPIIITANLFSNFHRHIIISVLKVGIYNS